MKNQQQSFFETAKNELPISNGQLLSEILPIMGDYFVGDIRYDGQNIIYQLPNGQTFLITVKRV